MRKITQNEKLKRKLSLPFPAVRKCQEMPPRDVGRCPLRGRWGSCPPAEGKHGEMPAREIR